MTGWHEGPLCGFDLETTSVDVETARIVTAAVIWRGTHDDSDSAWLVDPGIEIPETASEIHGITTEQARVEGMDAASAVQEICQQLELAMAEGWPLVIYNAPYDLAVLDRETRRHGVTPFAEAFEAHCGLVIDPFVLDKHVDPYRRGKRNLTAACETYAVTLDGAHNSTADAVAAMRVAWRIGRMHPQIAEMPLPELHELQVKAKAEQSASFQDYLRRQGSDEVVDGSWPFRQYAGGGA